MPQSIKRVLIFFVLIIVGAFLSFNAYTLSTGQCIPQSITRMSAAQDSAAMQTFYAGYILPNFGAPIIEIRADTLGQPLSQDAVTARYGKPSVRLAQGDSVAFTLTVPANGDYTFAFDAAVPDESAVPEAQLTLDGGFPIDDLRRFIVPMFYRNSSVTFPADRYGNDALIPQVRDVRWATTPIRDVNFSQPYPLRATLSAGTHDVVLTLTQGELYLGSFYAIPFTPYPSYESYLAQQHTPDVTNFSLTVEAEMPTYKNETSVRPASSRSLTVTPYDTYCLLLNMLGGDSWIKSGSTVYYQIDVPQDGLYSISLRALQNTRSNFTVYRRITINGQVPFEELNAVPFPYSADWRTMRLGGADPYRIFLQQGTNIIGIEATNAPYFRAIETIQTALLDINTLALEIKRLTGNQRDPFKEWVISDYIPDIESRLNTIAQNLLADKASLSADNDANTSPESQTYQIAIDNLLFLAANPNQIPNYMSRFSEGTGSASQLLGSLLPLLQNQPLALDTLTIHAPQDTAQTVSLPLTTALIEDYKRFLHSFKPDPYQSVTVKTGELEVWVNRPRQYVNLMQWITDSTFTRETGIAVRFSIMPDQGKLILANAADIQPDVALGISTHIPYELAIRNALYDLRSFSDFDSFIRIYSPGALLSYIINDSVYALPETQDFWVTFYRKDILESLNIPVPQTWDEVLEILPELQRYGMNYNTPLSEGGGLKAYHLSSPYLFNFNAPLYSDGGFATGLQDEASIDAVQFMADSFTIYGMPLTTVNFYQDFRYGTLPVGISNATTYIRLLTAAPEVGGLWNIDLYPATVLADGTHNRYATGSAQAGIMFKNTDMADEGWQFLKWWMSTETQTDFQEQLLLNYGQEYLWFSANLDAFRNLNINPQHRAVILNQWEWLLEPVRLPGSYMQERELSNAWNRIVFNGANTRVALDRAVITSNREIARKMEEFDYLKDGQRVKEIKIPTVETVKSWMNGDD